MLRDLLVSSLYQVTRLDSTTSPSTTRATVLNRVNLSNMHYVPLTVLLEHHFIMLVVSAKCRKLAHSGSGWCASRNPAADRGTVASAGPYRPRELG